MIDLEPAACEVARLLDGVTDDQLAGPTPCADTTVATLLDHLIGLSQAFTGAAHKSTETKGDGPDPEPPTADASSGTGAAPAGPPRLSEERRRRTEPGATAGERIEGDRPRRRRQEGQAAGARAPGSARVE